MLKVKSLCVCVMVILLVGMLAYGQSSQLGPGREKDSDSKFVVGPGEIMMPKGYFVLIRKGQKIGAMRFTSIEQGSELGTGKALYESYFQADRSASFHSPNVFVRTGEIDLKPLKGIGRVSFQFGSYKIKIGEWSFATGYPGSMDMWPAGKEEKDDGFEFAPTSAQSLGEIDASDNRLKWFRYDANTSITLPVSELAK